MAVIRKAQGVASRTLNSKTENCSLATASVGTSAFRPHHVFNGEKKNKKGAMLPPVSFLAACTESGLGFEGIVAGVAAIGSGSQLLESRT